MNEAEQWRFRGLVLSLDQKIPARKRAQYRRQIVAMLRSGYRLTRDDQLILADHIEGKKAGRPVGPVDKRMREVMQAVSEIRAYQARGMKKAEAIEKFKLDLMWRLGSEKKAEAHFKQNLQGVGRLLDRELSRAKPRHKSPSIVADDA